MKARKYAEKTNVPVGKSKDDITRLLRDWNCDQIGWQEDFRGGVLKLIFVWTRGDQAYGARIEVSVPTEKELRNDPENQDKRTGQPAEGRIRDALERQGRAELRLLLLFLKAAFNAVDAGIIDAETLFLPFLITKDGETVADTIVPKLPSLLSGEWQPKQLKS